MIAIAPKMIASESVVSAELDGEAVLLNVETGVYFGLDPLGSEIWKLLESGSSEDALFDALSAEYEVEPDQLRADLRDFLGTLEARGLVRPVAD